MTHCTNYGLDLLCCMDAQRFCLVYLAFSNSAFTYNMRVARRQLTLLIQKDEVKLKEGKKRKEKKMQIHVERQVGI